jgi:hypothetical protein
VEKGKGLTHAHETLKFRFSMQYLQKERTNVTESTGGGGFRLKQSAFSCTMHINTYGGIYMNVYVHVFICVSTYVNRFHVVWFRGSLWLNDYDSTEEVRHI